MALAIASPPITDSRLERPCLICDGLGANESYLCPACEPKTRIFRYFLRHWVRLYQVNPNLQREIFCSLSPEMQESIVYAIEGIWEGPDGRPQMGRQGTATRQLSVGHKYLLFRDIHYEKYQESMMFSSAPIQVLLSGNRVGKTEIAVGYKPAEMIAAKNCNSYPLEWPEKYRFEPPVKIVIGVTKFSVIPGRVVPKLMKWFPDWPIDGKSNDYWEIKRHTQGEIIFGLYKPTGSQFTIIAKSQEDRKDDTAEGFDAHAIFFDEEPSKEYFEGALRGVMDHEGFIMIACTPLIGEPWMHEQLIRPAADPDSGIHLEHWRIYQNHKDNGGVLSTAYINRLKRSCSPAVWACREGGQLIMVHGAYYAEEIAKFRNGIFRNVYPPGEAPKDEVGAVEFDPEWEVVCGMDWHASTPVRIEFCAINPLDQHIFFDELILDDYLLEEIADAIKHLEEKWGVKRLKDRVIDRSISKKMELSRGEDGHPLNILKELNRVMVERKLRPFTPVTGSFAAMPIVKKMLRPKQLGENLTIHPLILGHHCQELRETIETYSEARFASGPQKGEVKDEPDKASAKGAHALDAAHYIIGQRYTFVGLEKSDPKMWTKAWMEKENEWRRRHERRSYRRVATLQTESVLA